MSKIRILAIPPDQFGVGKYRILDPFKYIGDNYTDEFHVDIVMNADDNDEFFKNYKTTILLSFIVLFTKHLTKRISKELGN